MRISDWSSDVCSSDLRLIFAVLYPILALADRAPLARFFQRVMSDRIGLSDAHGGLAHPSPMAGSGFLRSTFVVDQEEHIPWNFFSPTGWGRPPGSGSPFSPSSSR